MDKVLVTGGAGFIGSHVCKALSKAGYLPVTVDNFCRGNQEAVKWGSFDEMDISNTQRLTGIMRKHSPKAVIHLAGLAYVGESTVDPSAYYKTNVLGTISVLNAMREAKINHIVFSSSCAVFGDAPEIDLNTPHNPISPYGSSKSMCERIIKDYSKAYGLRFSILRYFNAAGADEDGEIGEDHDPETHLIPRAIRAAMGKTDALVIYGANHPTLDGTCVRDYIHVSDLAEAHVLALNGWLSPECNLGRGFGYSVMEVLNTVESVVGKKVPYTIGEANPSDPPFLVCNPTSEFWKPKYDLRAIVEHAYAWELKRENKNGSN